MMGLFRKIFQRGEGEKPSINPQDLELPRSLSRLLEEGRWQTPEKPIQRRVWPCIESWVEFLPNQDAIRGEPLHVLADHMNTAQNFKVYRGSRDEKQPLPWVDVEKLLVLATGRDGTTDLAVALDYRGNDCEPVVVVTDWKTQPGVCNWVKSHESFEAFARDCVLLTKA